MPLSSQALISETKAALQAFTLALCLQAIAIALLLMSKILPSATLQCNGHTIKYRNANESS